MAMIEPEGLDIREQIVRIDQMIADQAKNRAQHDRLRQEVRFAPALLVFAGLTAGAAIFAAGAGVGAVAVKLMIGG